METVAPEKPQQMSDKVSSKLKGFWVIVLSTRLSKTSQPTPTIKNPKRIFKIDFRDKSFKGKTKIKTIPTQSPPKKCKSMSKYQILEYQ